MVELELYGVLNLELFGMVELEPYGDFVLEHFQRVRCERCDLPGSEVGEVVGAELCGVWEVE